MPTARYVVIDQVAPEPVHSSSVNHHDDVQQDDEEMRRLPSPHPHQKFSFQDHGLRKQREHTNSALADLSSSSCPPSPLVPTPSPTNSTSSAIVIRDSSSPARKKIMSPTLSSHGMSSPRDPATTRSNHRRRQQKDKARNRNTSSDRRSDHGYSSLSKHRLRQSRMRSRDCYAHAHHAMKPSITSTSPEEKEKSDHDRRHEEEKVKLPRYDSCQKVKLLMKKQEAANQRLFEKRKRKRAKCMENRIQHNPVPVLPLDRHWEQQQWNIYHNPVLSSDEHWEQQQWNNYHNPVFSSDEHWEQQQWNNYHTPLLSSDEHWEQQQWNNYHTPELPLPSDEHSEHSKTRRQRRNDYCTIDRSRYRWSRQEDKNRPIDHSLYLRAEQEAVKSVAHRRPRQEVVKSVDYRRPQQEVVKSVAYRRPQQEVVEIEESEESEESEEEDRYIIPPPIACPADIAGKAKKVMSLEEYVKCEPTLMKCTPEFAKSLDEKKIEVNTTSVDKKSSRSPKKRKKEHSKVPKKLTSSASTENISQLHTKKANKMQNIPKEKSCREVDSLSKKHSSSACPEKNTQVNTHEAGKVPRTHKEKGRREVPCVPEKQTSSVCPEQNSHSGYNDCFTGRGQIYPENCNSGQEQNSYENTQVDTNNAGKVPRTHKKKDRGEVPCVPEKQTSSVCPEEYSHPDYNDYSAGPGQIYPENCNSGQEQNSYEITQVDTNEAGKVSRTHKEKDRGEVPCVPEKQTTSVSPEQYSHPDYYDYSAVPGQIYPENWYCGQEKTSYKNIDGGEEQHYPHAHGEQELKEMHANEVFYPASTNDGILVYVPCVLKNGTLTKPN